MAELVPAPFADLVARLYAESQTNDSIFALPRKKWYTPDATEPDLSVKFHSQLAGNASGPAAGPQTQMAQNILLSYLAGGRILELKTVQINDRLTIPRPCIDVTNIGYNVEWSQELLLEESLREYVAGMMLIEIFRRDASIVERCHPERTREGSASTDGTARSFGVPQDDSADENGDASAFAGPAGDVI